MLDSPKQKKKETTGQKVLEEYKICEFYVQRKKRQCKFKVMKGSKFCQTHCSDLQGKIKCPYENGTYVDISNFQKHLQNCPKIKQQNRAAASAWFQKNVNQKSIQPNKLQNLQQKQTEFSNKNNSQLLIQSTKHELANIDPSKIENLIPKIIDIYLESFPKQFSQKFIQSSDVQETPLQIQTNDHKQAFLIAEKALKYKLISPQIIYVQFGAGKGILSYAIGKKVQSISNRFSKNILLERQSRRNKFDKHFRLNPYFQRYKSDVSDFNMSNIGKIMVEYIRQKDEQQQRTQLVRKNKREKNQEKRIQQKVLKKQKKQQKIVLKQFEKHQHDRQSYKQSTIITLQEQLKDLNSAQKVLMGYPIIGICKHMCGLALDISVRGLLKAHIGGTILASCCHHLCTYNSFLNVQFFQSKELNAEQIQLLFKLSSWGTKSAIVKFKNHLNIQKIEKQEFSNQIACFQEFINRLKDKEFSTLQEIEKVVVGRMCKRIIDKARAQFLGGNVQRYCSDQLTPENYVIVSKNI